MLAGITGMAVLVLLPGAWVTFGLPFAGFPFWARLLTGAALAPLIVGLQFYAVRILGASFEFSVFLLVVINLPAVYLIWKHGHELSILDSRAIVGCVLVLLLPLAFAWLHLSDPQIRIFLGHPWQHADIIYMLANGDLLPDDPELVGVRLAYPWAGHVYQAVLSYLLGSSPASNYVWSNLLCLLLIYGFLAGIVSELGGNRFSRITSPVWLFFGVNFLGYVLHQIVPMAFAANYPIWGDYRISPFLRYFFALSPMLYGLAMFIAIVYLLIRPQRFLAFAWSPVISVFFLLCGIGIIYPILVLPASAVICAKIVALYFNPVEPAKEVFYKESLALGTVVFIVGCITVIHLNFLTRDRANETMIAFSGIWAMKMKVASAVLVSFPLLVGLALALSRLWKARRDPIIFLGLGALASGVLYVLLNIPNGENEYKFLFTLAICLAPFPALALEPFMERLGRKAAPVFAIITLILAAPLTHRVYKYERGALVKGPLVDGGNFDLRLNSSNPLSNVVDAIRKETPADSILALENDEIHFPTLTRRRLFVPPVGGKRAGVNVSSDFLLKGVRGYDPHMIDERRLTVRELFHSDEASRKARALGKILGFNHPVAIVLQEKRDAALLDWLISAGIGRSGYQGNGSILWLVEPTESIALQGNESVRFH